MEVLSGDSQDLSTRSPPQHLSQETEGGLECRTARDFIMPTQNVAQFKIYELLIFGIFWSMVDHG